MPSQPTLSREDAVLLVVDVQGKLAQLMDGKDDLFANLRLMIRGARVLDVPVVVTEQYPQGMGSTVPEIAELLDGIDAISKTSFSCCGEPAFTDALQPLGRSQVLLTGIETHICVQQTALDLVHRGYAVQVVADAVSSRTAENRRIGLEKMRDAGVVITSTETALYELLHEAGGPQFKAILQLVKEATPHAS